MNKIIPLLAVIFSLAAVADNSGLIKKLTQLSSKGNAEAQYHLGMFYNNGLHVPKDPKQAFAWFQKSAKGGNALAAYKLGCYYGGQFGDAAPNDKEKSFQYKLIAANAGYSLAQHDVAGVLFNDGKFEESIRYLEMAAGQGDPQSLN